MQTKLQPFLRVATLVEPSKVVHFEANIYPQTRYGSDDVEKVKVIAILSNGSVLSMRVLGWEDYTSRLTDGQRRDLESEARARAEHIQ